MYRARNSAITKTRSHKQKFLKPYVHRQLLRNFRNLYTLPIQVIKKGTFS